MKQAIGIQDFQELQEELLNVNNEEELLNVLKKIDPEFKEEK